MSKLRTGFGQNLLQESSVLAPSSRLSEPWQSTSAVHHNTVAEAYRRLADEGWLELKRHHGAIVRERDRPAAGPDTMERFARPLRELIAKGLADGLTPSSLAREMIETARKLEGEALP